MGLFADLWADVTDFAVQSVEVGKLEYVSDARQGSVEQFTVTKTVRGSLQPYNGPAGTDGVNLTLPRFKLFLEKQTVTNEPHVCFRVNGIVYYPLQPVQDVGGQGELTRVLVTTKRPT